MKFLVVLTVLLALLVGGFFDGHGRAASPGMIATSSKVIPACPDADGFAKIDPVVAPGLSCTPSAHFHIHAGPVGIDSNETYDSALAKRTGFVIPGWHSWGAWPEWSYAGLRTGKQLTSTTGALPGSAAASKGAAFYYRRKGAPTGVVVQPFPHAFAMVMHAGDIINGQLVNLGEEIIFKCGPGSTTDLPHPPTTCGTNIMVDNYIFPNCWNGVFAGPFINEVAAGNMSYPVNSKCPAAFPIALPRVEQFRRSDVTEYKKGAATLDPNLFTLGGHPFAETGAAHADYVALVRDDVMSAFLNDCINFRSPTSGAVVGKDCGTNPPALVALG